MSESEVGSSINQLPNTLVSWLKHLSGDVMILTGSGSCSLLVRNFGYASGTYAGAQAAQCQSPGRIAALPDDEGRAWHLSSNSRTQRITCPVIRDTECSLLVVQILYPSHCIIGSLHPCTDSTLLTCARSDRTSRLLETNTYTPPPTADRNSSTLGRLAIGGVY